MKAVGTVRFKATLFPRLVNEVTLYSLFNGGNIRLRLVTEDCNHKW
jgi:hypothetical protein